MRKIHAREKQHRLTQKTITPFTVGSPKMADNTMETTLSANVKRGTVDIYKSGAGSDKGRDCSIIQGNKDRNILPTWRNKSQYPCYAWWASRRTSTASLSAGRSSQQWIRNWKKLYTSESTREVKLLEDFFGNLNIPSICEREKPLEEPISLEEVILAIRSLQGSKAQGHKVLLNADDLLLYISKPSVWVPMIMSVLKTFGRISGYKPNISKIYYILIYCSQSMI